MIRLGFSPLHFPTFTSSQGTMADPLSVAGLVAGVVSLGLQVYGGIETYLDGINARPFEIEDARRKAVDMSDSLQRLEAVVVRLFDAEEAAIRHAVESCYRQTERLRIMVNDLTSLDGGSQGLRHYLRKNKTKLMFPFHREALRTLEGQVDSVTNSLGFLVQVLQFEMTISVRQDMGSVKQDVTRFLDVLPSDAYSQPRISLPSTQIATRNQLQAATTTASPNRGLNEMNTESGCICRRKRVSTRLHRRWGPWNMMQDLMRSEGHFPDCRYRNPASEEKTILMSLELVGWSSIIKTAIGVSLHVKQTSAGMSVAPCLTYYPRVDPKTAPAFQVVRHLKNFYQMNMFTPDEDVVGPCLTSLVKLYRTKRASPLEIDSSGRTVLYDLSQVMYGIYEDASPATISSYEHAVRELVQLGVPASRQDDEGETVFSQLMRYRTFPLKLLSSELAGKVLYSGPDVAMTLNPLDFSSVYIGKSAVPAMVDLFYRSSEIAEACNCGPLTLAAIARDEKLVAALLSRHPETIHEQNYMGHTPVHLATNSPSCLKLLLESSQYSHTTRNSYGERLSPLEFAIELGNWVSIRLLLGAGCSIKAWVLHGANENLELLSLLLDEVKERRDDLKRLGLRHLTRYQIEQFRLNKDVTLDMYSDAVFNALSDLGVRVPSALKPFSSFDMEAMGYSLYNWVDAGVPGFQMLWDRGFRDIDSLGTDDMPPILRRWLHPYSTRGDNNQWLRTQCWLIDHGADIWTPFAMRKTARDMPRTDPLTPAHYLLGSVGCDNEAQIMSPHTGTERVRKIFECCLARDLEHGCHCHCSSRGCKPWTFFLKYLGLTDNDSFNYPISPLWIEPRPDELCQAFITFIDKVGLTLTTGHHEAAIQMFTFRAMGARHTCCFSKYQYSPVRPTLIDDAHEINDEQIELLQYIDQLVTELTETFREPTDGGNPLGIADPNEFWNVRWLPRIRDAQKIFDSRRLTQDELRQAEDLGVVWDSEDNEAFEWPPLSSLPDMSVDGFCKALDRILHEA